MKWMCLVMKRNRKILGLIILILTLISIFSYVFLNQGKPVSRFDNEPIIFTVESGTGPTQIVSDLKEQDLIRSELYALDYIEKNELMFYPNSYEVDKTMSTGEILNIVANPKSNSDYGKLVLYEGTTVVKTADAIEVATKGDITSKEMLKLWSDETYLQTLIDEYWFLTNEILNEEILYPLEGYLAPATYSIPKGATPEEVTEMILDNTAQVFAPYEGMTFPNDYTLHQVLTFASIVERETITTEDKYLVSGVFYNRINQGMLLQSDITVLYALQEHKEIVTYEDLEVESPYNTYLYSGLPPGPIASPSSDSIDATINPTSSNYLYFFATQDTGEVLYSETYEQHLIISEENAWE
jgi:UPF0755 protein